MSGTFAIFLIKICFNLKFIPHLTEQDQFKNYETCRLNYDSLHKNPNPV